MRATQVDTDMPKLIDHTIMKEMDPLIKRMTKCEGTIKIHREILDDLTAKLKDQEEFEGISGTLDPMRDEITNLMAEVVQLQSMNISML